MLHLNALRYSTIWYYQSHKKVSDDTSVLSVIPNYVRPNLSLLLNYSVFWQRKPRKPKMLPCSAKFYTKLSTYGTMPMKKCNNSPFGGSLSRYLLCSSHFKIRILQHPLICKNYFKFDKHNKRFTCNRLDGIQARENKIFSQIVSLPINNNNI